MGYTCGRAVSFDSLSFNLVQLNIRLIPSLKQNKILDACSFIYLTVIWLFLKLLVYQHILKTIHSFHSTAGSQALPLVNKQGTASPRSLYCMKLFPVHTYSPTKQRHSLQESRAGDHGQGYFCNRMKGQHSFKGIWNWNMLQRKGNRPLGGVELPGLLLGPTGRCQRNRRPQTGSLAGFSATLPACTTRNAIAITRKESAAWETLLLKIQSAGCRWSFNLSRPYVL